MAKSYKPSVGYDPQYKAYIDDLKKETGYAGAQIIRLALFTASQNPEFIRKLTEHLEGADIPQPSWDAKDDALWQFRTAGEVDQSDQESPDPEPVVATPLPFKKEIERSDEYQEGGMGGIFFNIK
jgi:hypothetical protein